MKTDKKTMAEVLRKVADNLDRGININNEIQVKYEHSDDWSDRNGCAIYFGNDDLYRIKPKTITVNGVEIPKPLDYKDMISGNTYYYVSPTKYMFNYAYCKWIKSHGIKFVYKTKQEAIEASKKLFGIE